MHTNKWQGLTETLRAHQVPEIEDVLCYTATGPRRVLLALLVLQLRGAWLSVGICWYVQALCRIVRPVDVLRPHFESWEHYSGDAEFPVEGSLSEYFHSNKWEGKYGGARRALLQHCIESLCKQLDTTVEYELLCLSWSLTNVKRN